MKRKSTREPKIDYSDIPEFTPAQLKQFKRVGRPLSGLFKRKMIAIRLDESILNELKNIAKEDGKGYQTLINEILEKYVRKKAA